MSNIEYNEQVQKDLEASKKKEEKSVEKVNEPVKTPEQEGK